MAKILALGLVLLMAISIFHSLMKYRDWGDAAPEAKLDGAAVNILVQGWNDDQIAQILRQFEELYGFPAGSLRPVRLGEQRHEIAIEGKIAAWHVAFLVNHLHYPQDMDPAAAASMALARFRIDEACPFARQSEYGQMACFYVPLNDSQFDEVYASLENGEVFRLSFAETTWERVADARKPLALNALLERAIKRRV